MDTTPASRWFFSKIGCCATQFFEIDSKALKQLLLQEYIDVQFVRWPATELAS